VQDISFINFKRNYFDYSCFSHFSRCSGILQRKRAGRYSWRHHVPFSDGCWLTVFSKQVQILFRPEKSAYLQLV